MNWLILRGLVREQRHWGGFKQEFETALQAKKPLSRVHSIDFPGFGTENLRRSPTQIKLIVDDMRSRWIETQKTSEEPWGLLAVSLGGMVAVDWCHRYPNDFKKLVLINSSLKGLNPVYERLHPAKYGTIASLLLTKEITAREAKIIEMTTHLKSENLKQRAKKHAEFALPIRRIDALSQILAAMRFSPPSKLELPALVLVSEGDQLVSPKCSEKIAQYFKAEIRRHSTANHDLAIDDPNWIIQQVCEWGLE
jgi:pimeloyl-[acyl-carrier protein] methyl ester esterase